MDFSEEIERTDISTEILVKTLMFSLIFFFSIIINHGIIIQKVRMVIQKDVIYIIDTK